MQSFHERSARELGSLPALCRASSRSLLKPSCLRGRKTGLSESFPSMYHSVMDPRHRKSKSVASELGSILLFGAATFTVVSLLTYYPNDPSVFSNAQGVVGN